MASVLRLPFDESDDSEQENTPTTRRSSPRRQSHRRSTNVNSPRPGPSTATQTPTRNNTRPPPARNNTRPPPARRKKNRPNKMDREINLLRKSTVPQIPKLPFCRLLKQILHSFRADFRMNSQSVDALQEAVEMYVTQFLEDAYICTLHRQQVTLKPVDMALVRVLRESNQMYQR